MVIMVMALVFVLVSIILTITITNTVMKDAGKKSTMNFYDAESSMDEIKAALASSCYKAYTHAVSTATGTGVVYRDQTYRTDFTNYLVKTLKDTATSTSTVTYYKLDSFRDISGVDIRGTDNSTYDKTYNGLSSCLKGTAIAVKDPTNLIIGGEVTTQTGENVLNIYPDEGYVVLKNVSVKYTDDHDYVSTIKTDIRVSCPDISIAETATLNNILYYTIITDGHVDLSGPNTSVFNGNMFLGYNESKIHGGYNVTFNQGGTSSSQISYFLSGGRVTLDKATLNLTNSQLWVKAINLKSLSTGKNTFKLTAGSNPDETRLYLQDDIAVGAKSSVTLSGKLYGFGNSDALLAAGANSGNDANSFAVKNEAPVPGYDAIDQSAEPTEQKLLEKAAAGSTSKDTGDIILKPYEYNSSIVINGKDSTVDLSNLSTMSLAGNAYVNANPKGSGTNPYNLNNDIRTGESVSVKSDQRAYYVPPSVLITSCNPVSGSTFEAKYSEIVSERLATGKYPDGTDVIDENKDGTIDALDVKVYTTDFIVSTGRTDANDWTTTPIKEFGNKTFNELGVDNIKLASFQTMAAGSSSRPITYFFMHFKDDKAANDFFLTYYNVAKNYNTLNERLHYYTDPSGINLPGTVSSSTSNFFFNGNLVTTNQAKVYVPSSLSSMTDADVNDKRVSDGALFDMYYALCTNLSSTYETLSPDEKTRTLFNNIIDYNALKGVDAGTSHTPKKYYYVSDTGVGTVLVYDKDSEDRDHRKTIEINNNDIAEIGNLYHSIYNGNASDAKLSLVVTNTNVEVKLDSYKGLILAQGDVEISRKCDFSQAPSDVAIAINAVTTDTSYGVKSPREIFRDPDKYLIGGVAGANPARSAATGSIALPSLVTYENWERK